MSDSQWKNIITNPDVDEKTWRLAVGMVISDMHNKQSKMDLVLFGNGEPEKGLVTKLATLKKEVTLRGSFWGVIGGGGMTAVLGLLYALLKTGKL